MALDLTPWMIGGGAEHSVEVARLLAYAATSGAEGVVEPASLRVTAQSTPNGTVSVRPGAALILNRYAGGGQQTYVLRNASATSVTIPATGAGGGRTDAIIARVLDPQYEGAAPSNPVTFNYARLERIASVPSSLTDIKQLNLTYPAVLLARVQIPASTGTITNGMITDLRKVAIPRRETVLRTYNLTSGEGHALGNKGTYPTQSTWPLESANAMADFEIPAWATRVKVVVTWAGVKVPPGSVVGWVWAQIGANANADRIITQAVKYDSPNSTNTQRTTLVAADEKYVPAGLRGTSQKLYPSGNVLSESSASARLTSDSGTAVVVQLEFLETAD